jgi:hypothetical protein
MASVTGSVEVAVAVRLALVPTRALVGVFGAKVMLWAASVVVAVPLVAALTVAVHCAFAGAKDVVPATLASTTQLPAARNRTLPPLRLHSLVALASTARVTGRPEVAVAVSGVVPPTVASVTLAGSKVIVWVCVVADERVPAVVALTVTFCCVLVAP